MDTVSCNEDMAAADWWRKVILPIAICAILVFAFSGTRPLMDTSEARYAETAREMAFEGHWLVPHLGGQPHLTKPPLTYWLVGASSRLFGESEWAVRLPIGLAALGTTLLTSLLARSMFGPRAGVYAVWLQGLSLVPLGAANVITTDTLLTTFEVGYMWCAWALLRAEKTAHSRLWWQLGFWAFLGGAFMTKGPAGFVPLLPLVVFIAIFRRHVNWKAIFGFWGILLFLVIVLPWPIAVLMRVPNAWAIWQQETLTNVVEESTNDFPRWGFPLLLLFGSFPASLGFAPAFFLRNTEASHKVRLAQLYLLLWTGVSLAILALQKTRLPLYVLPLFPPLSALGAHGFELWLDYRKETWVRAKRWCGGLVAIYVVLFLAGKWYYSATIDVRDSRRSFKGVAEIIRKNLAQPDQKPIVYTAEGKLGYGLMYYLKSSSLVRLGKKSPRGEAVPPRTFAELLGTTRTKQQQEFLLIETNKEGRIQELLEKHAERIGSTRAYTVWKVKN